MGRALVFLLLKQQVYSNEQTETALRQAKEIEEGIAEKIRQNEYCSLDGGIECLMAPIQL